jgi:DNA mismatch repair protein MutS2
MTPGFAVGDAVQTSFGKGIVREVRNNGSLLVLIGSRNLVLEASAVKALSPPPKAGRAKRGSAPAVPVPENRPSDARGAQSEIDLHGLSVADALVRVESAVNDALLAGHVRLSVIHGRSGGRIKAALHRELRAMPAVRAFHLHPANEGVTVVEF